MKKFVITEEEKKHIMGLYEETLASTIDLKKIQSTLSSRGFKNSPYTGYKLHMDIVNNGPVKDRKGNYIPSYEAYVPEKQDNSGFGYTDGKTPQLWIDKRSGLKAGEDSPNTYNYIFDLNPNNLMMQMVKNGKVLSKSKITVDEFFNKIKSV